MYTYDVLGTANSPYFGLGAQPRMRMGWIKKETEIKIVRTNEQGITLYPVGSSATNVYKVLY